MFSYPETTIADVRNMLRNFLTPAPQIIVNLDY